jgi:hypothetical protein
MAGQSGKNLFSPFFLYPKVHWRGSAVVGGDNDRIAEKGWRVYSRVPPPFVTASRANKGYGYEQSSGTKVHINRRQSEGLPTKGRSFLHFYYTRQKNTYIELFPLWPSIEKIIFGVLLVFEGFMVRQWASRRQVLGFSLEGRFFLQPY